MQRRTFLTNSAAAGLAAYAWGADAPRLKAWRYSQAGVWENRRATHDYRPGGRHDFPLHLRGRKGSHAARLRTRRQLFRFARIYWQGRSEEVYGDVLPPFQKEYLSDDEFSGPRTREGAAADLDKSLRALKTDYVDLWQIHQVAKMEEVEQIFAPGGAIEAFEAAKKAGKCRFIGFTGHTDPKVHLAMLEKYDKYDSILMPLNPADPSYLSFENLCCRWPYERGMGIQGMKSTANAKDAANSCQ